MNIKAPVNLKLQSRGHTDTLIFTSIHLMYLMTHILFRKLKKIIVSEFFFQIWHFFIFYRHCNYKQIRWRYTGSTFLELKIPLLKRFWNYKQIRWQYTDNTWLRYVPVVSFIIIAFVIVKLKIFGLIQHSWNDLFLGFFGPLISQILFNLDDILTRGSLQ